MMPVPTPMGDYFKTVCTPSLRTIPEHISYKQTYFSYTYIHIHTYDTLFMRYLIKIYLNVNNAA
jgi:hypothetical protein